jgi:hypothetical protein
VNRDQAFSTRGGWAAFRVELEDGTVITEADHTWNDVPRDKRVRELQIVELKTAHPWARLPGMRSVFFMNEGVGLAPMGTGGGRQIHTAKIFGGIRQDGTVIEARLWFEDGDPRPRVQQSEYQEDYFPYDRELVLRAGVV